MEGRVRVVCSDCGRTREVSGEMPGDYTECFLQVVREDGFVPRPGSASAFVCGECLKGYEGSETHDDQEKIGRKTVE